MLAANFIAFKTIVIKELLRFSRIWIQTVLPATITTSLYFIIFGNLIGQRIGKMDGFSYIDFIVPGLILMTVITNSYSNVVSSFFSAKFQRHIEEMLVSPVSHSVIILGFVCGGIGRGLAVGAAVTLVSCFFVDIQLHSPLITIAVVVLTSAVFALAGFINAVFAKTFDDISIVPVFVLTPLTYLGGVFYSVSLLPEFWRDVSLWNPVLYMVNAFRYGLLGVSDIRLLTSFLIISGFLLGLFGVALYLMNRGYGIRA